MKKNQSLEVVYKTLNHKLISCLVISLLLLVLAFTGVMANAFLSEKATLVYDNKQGTIKNNSVGLNAETTQATFPVNWKSEITDSTSGVEISCEAITSILFEYENSSALAGYTDTNKTLSTGIKIYKKDDSSGLDIAFVYVGQIVAPEVSSKLFKDLTSLQSISFTNFNTSIVTRMVSMFNGCSSLSNIDVSKFNTNSVTSMDSMFRSCCNITTLDLSSFDTSLVTNMSYMFYNCEKLKVLNLSSFNMENVTGDTTLFSGCSGFTILNTPCYVNTRNIRLPDAMYDADDYYKAYLFLPDGLSISHTFVSEKPNTVFPSTWRDQINSSTYMTTEIDSSTITSIQFVANIPSGYELAGTLATGIQVYNNGTDVAFVYDKPIYAPEDSSDLFSLLSVTSIEFSNFNTIQTRSMNGMFKLSKIESLDLTSFNTMNVCSFSYMFFGCGTLKDINLSGFNTKNVFEMTGMFYGCNKLTNIDVSDFDTSYVKNFDKMFYGCNNLINLDLSNFDTSVAMNMEYMFYECKKLESLDVSNFNTSNVSYMKCMFCGCTKLTSLDLSSFQLTTTNSDNVDSMISGCNILTEIKTPNVISEDLKDSISLPGGGWLDVTADREKIKYLPITNGESHVIVKNSIFPRNWVKQILTNGTVDADSDILYSSMRKSINANKLTEIRFLANISTSEYKKIGMLSSGIFVYQNISNETDVAFVNSGDILAPNDSTMLFGSLQNLQVLEFDNFNTSYVQDMDSMFQECYKIKVLDLSKFNTSNVTDMALMFRKCNSLTTLDISNFDTSNVTRMRSMFVDCSSLLEINLNSFNTTNIKDMNGMFLGCKSLTSLDLSSFDTTNVTDMHQMFYGCIELNDINLTNFNTAKVTDMNWMFLSCVKLVSLDLSDFDMSNVTSTSSMLTNCTSLTELKTPKNVKISISLTKTMYDYSDYSTWSSLPIDESFSRTFNSTAPTFDITLNDSGDGIINSSSYILNEAEQSLNISTPSCIGYSFNGWTVDWSDDIHSATLPTILGETLTIPANCYGNIRITANYSANVYSNILYYDVNGGSNGPNAQIENVTYPNTKFTHEISKSVPTRLGYTFLGWFTTIDGDTSVGSMYVVGSDNIAENQSATIYAHWEIVTYNISYNLNGGTSNNPQTYTIDTETFTLNNPVKADFTFVGWIGSNGENPQTVVTIERGSTGNKEFTANWTQFQVKPTAIEGLIYNGLEQIGIANYSSNGFDLISGQIKATNAGNYTVTFKLKDGFEWQDNTTQDVEITYTIAKKGLLVTAENKNMTYGENVPTYSFEISGFVNNETVSNLTGNIIYTIKNSSNETVEITTISNVGVYTIIPSGFSSNNYEITYIYGTLSVTKAQLNAPTNLLVNSYGIVTFDGVVGATSYEISLNNSIFTTCVNGNDYNDLITAVAGERTINVKALSTDENYVSTSDIVTTSVMVYTLTLKKEDSQGVTKISSTNYISGRVVDLSIELDNDNETVKWVTDDGDKILDSKSNNASLTITKDTIITAKIELVSNSTVTIIIICSIASLILIMAVVIAIEIINKKKKKRARINRIIINKLK